ncbi:hypothetical protein JN531_003970 [Flagellatimonas centrodinii]|uniref:hypothetical protein n=1 Tax=Flagellatimonas centrodinii TaxID=2806210 RepID=UPI001FEEB443|nr:hypothetical protein [Flagellatimonas centrodinii]ULQ47444.1 hypothetical protein JN531_003970 [Flagellatimonas centrodinii]
MCEKILNWLNCGTCALLGVMTGFVLGIPVITTVQYLDLEPEWVQAVGSIGAILAAVWIAARQGKQSLENMEKEHQKRRQEAAGIRKNRRHAVEAILAPAVTMLRAVETGPVTCEVASQAFAEMKKRSLRLRAATEAASMDFELVSTLSRLVVLVDSSKTSFGLKDPTLDRNDAAASLARKEAQRGARDLLKEINSHLDEIFCEADHRDAS